jgi:hypothetical protein
MKNVLTRVRNSARFNVNSSDRVGARDLTSPEEPTNFPNVIVDLRNESPAVNPNFPELTVINR